MEELSKFDFDVENYENPPLINNIAEALEVCHSRYEKLKKKNNQQKDEHDMVQVGIASIMQMHCNDTGTKNNHDWKKTLGMIRARHFEFLKNAGEEEKEKEKEKEISENEPVQAIHSQDIATESKNDSEDVDDNDDDDIDFTVTNTGIIRDNIFGDDDEFDEKDMNNINDPSDGKEVVTRGSETMDANDGDKPRQTAATDTRIARNDDNDLPHEKEVVTRGSERTTQMTETNQERQRQLT